MPSHPGFIQGTLMSLTVLFDLDDTLLQTNMEEFLPGYFKALGQAFSDLAKEEEITQQIRFAISQMAANQNPGKMLNTIFSENFYKPLGTSEYACQKTINRFYHDEFPKLRPLTQAKPAAREVVNWCHSQRLNIAIATNPVFPETATRQRIEWAGLNPDDFAFFSTFNNFHFIKPNLSYYAECLGRLGWPEQPAMMIGDSLTYDLLPMEKMGFQTFWIALHTNATERAHGELSDVKPWLEKINRTNSSLREDNFEVQLAVLQSTPAVFDTWIRTHSEDMLSYQPSENEWSFVEVLWHLAEIEKEVYLPQWKQLLCDPSAYISPVNASAWVKERGYQDRDPLEAFEILLEARMSSLSEIRALHDKDYFTNELQHPIFSQTTIAELVAFSAKHDRIHLRQSQYLLNIYKNY